MQRRKKSHLLLFTFRRHTAHRQSRPIVFANKDLYVALNLTSTEETVANYIKTEKNDCNTIRPLLPLKRFETGKICMFWHLPIYPDLSNQKLKFLRNRLRKQLLPTLKVFFNPQIENVLLQFAEIVDVENFYLNQTTTQLIKTFIKPNENKFAKAFVTLKGDARSLDVSLLPSVFTPSCYQVNRGISSRLPKGSSTKIISSKDSNYDKLPESLTTFVNLPYKKNSSNVENFYPSNLFCRFSMPIRTTYWVWDRKFSRKSRWNNSSKREIEYVLLSMFNLSVIKSPSNYYKLFDAAQPQGFKLGNFYERKERPRFSTPWGYKSLGCNQRLTRDKLGVTKKFKIPNVSHYQLDTSFFSPRDQRIYLASKKNNNHKLLLLTYVDQSFGVKQANRLAIGDQKLAKKRKKRLSICKGLASDLTTTPKNLLVGSSYNKKMNDIFATNFFWCFETLEMEKKEIYWPIIMSFFPIAVQRRVVKLFFSTQNWKKIRYSHIENFLEKRKISNSV